MSALLVAAVLLAQAEPHAGHADHAAPADAAPIGDAPAPPPPVDHAADRDWDPVAMDAARRQLRKEHGGGTYRLVTIPILEVRAQDGRSGYRWEGEGWYGSDDLRGVVKTEGEGRFGDTPAEAEAQALVSTPIDAYWDIQAGLRQDFGEGPDRTHMVVTAEGLAPYWFEVTGSLFLSHRGELSGRVEASYDLRLTQNVTLQPRIELNFSAEDGPERGIGPGLSDAELETRLSYRIVQEVRPYVGVTYERQFGRTRRLTRAGGEKPPTTRLVIGLATFF